MLVRVQSRVVVVWSWRGVAMELWEEHDRQGSTPISTRTVQHDLESTEPSVRERGATEGLCTLRANGLGLLPPAL